MVSIVGGMAWVVVQAAKALGKPALEGALEAAQEQVEGAVHRRAHDAVARLFGRADARTEDSGSQGGPRTTTAATAATIDDDIAATVALDDDPEFAEALRSAIERALGVELSAVDAADGGANPGTAEWYVDIYVSVLWRVATLATRLGQPIAVDGALQGEDRITVCVPDRSGTPISPDALFKRHHERTLRVTPSPRVEFYVRRVGDADERRRLLAQLNERFGGGDAGADFPLPGDDQNGAAGWHRIDGLGRNWVALQPDAALVEELNERVPDFLKKKAWHYEAAPLDGGEYPASWKPLIDIPDASVGIAALSAGADAFTAANEARIEKIRRSLDP